MFRFVCAAVVLLGSANLYADGQSERKKDMADLPRVFLIDAVEIAEVRERVSAGDKSLEPAVRKLRKDAASALRQGPFSVTYKETIPPSGDKHDYVSMGPYWWPDPSKPDGLPYIRKDGVVNPEGRNLDSGQKGKMQSAVNTLALAYYLTGEERYAEHAVKLLKVWFIDKETKMNPNLNFGQAIPGVTEGRGIGIIDTAGFGKLVDSIGLLEESKSLSPGDVVRLKAWFRDYVKWLRESKHGKDEENTKNNHATWYDVQTSAMALFVGDTETAREILGKSASRRIDTQIEPDGRQPHELARTKSLSYSLANLAGMFDIARLAEHIGLDLWNYESPDGRSIRKALDWLVPYATGEKEWDHQQITGVSDQSYIQLLRRAGIKYSDPAYEAALSKLKGVNVEVHRTQLLHPKPVMD